MRVATHKHIPGRSSRLKCVSRLTVSQTCAWVACTTYSWLEFPFKVFQTCASSHLRYVRHALFLGSERVAWLRLRELGSFAIGAGISSSRLQAFCGLHRVGNPPFLLRQQAQILYQLSSIDAVSELCRLCWVIQYLAACQPRVITLVELLVAAKNDTCADAQTLIAT